MRIYQCLGLPSRFSTHLCIFLKSEICQQFFLLKVSCKPMMPKWTSEGIFFVGFANVEVWSNNAGKRKMKIDYSPEFRTDKYGFFFFFMTRALVLLVRALTLQGNTKAWSGAHSLLDLLPWFWQWGPIPLHCNLLSAQTVTLSIMKSCDLTHSDCECWVFESKSRL